MTVKIALLALMVIVLCACATPQPTPYQKANASGGFSETQLDTNVFRVTFHGNSFTQAERAADFALLRSAELTLQNGYSFFVIVDSSQDSKLSSYTTPATTLGSATIYKNNAYGTATTYGGQTHLVSKPSMTNTIECFAAKPEGLFSYNARFIEESMKRKYGPGLIRASSQLAATASSPAIQAGWSRNITGTYRGEIWSGTQPSVGVTLFTLDDAGQLSGSYSSGTDTGLLSNCSESNPGYALSCQWRARNTTGGLEIVFADDLASFAGFWNFQGSPDRFAWNGSR